MVKPLPLACPDFQDPFSLTEKPPAEFCLSPDGNSEAISIDLLQKKGGYYPSSVQEFCCHYLFVPVALLSGPPCLRIPGARKELREHRHWDRSLCTMCHEYVQVRKGH